MMDARQVSAVVAGLILFCTTGLKAQAGFDASRLSFDGYGTLGLVYSDEDRADFVSDFFAPEGAGYTSQVSPEVDSRLGLQMSAELASRLSGVVQVVTKQRYDDTYKPTLEWANLKYDLTPDLSVRAGRMVLPVFLVGDYRNVGFALPWVRPPQEVYQVIPVTNFDGLEFTLQSRFDDYHNTLRGTYGRKDVRSPELGEFKSRNGVSVTDTLEWGPMTLYGAYTRYELTIEDVQPLFDGIRQFGPQGNAIADRYDLNGKVGEVLSVGARYEPGDWFVMGEWVTSKSRSFLGDSRGWYVTAGYHYGAVTPYATLAATNITSNTSDPGLSLAGLSPVEAATATRLNVSLNQLLEISQEQKSLSLGVRWDFSRNAALKVQYDHVDLNRGSRGFLINTQPDFRPGGTVNLISIAVDFVF